MSNTAAIKQTPFDVVLSSVVLAYFVDTKSISVALTYGDFIHIEEGGLMVPLYFMAAIGIVFCFIKNYSHYHSLKLSSVGVFLAVYLVTYYYYTKFFLGNPGTSINMFLIMTILAFLSPQLLMVDTKVFLKTTMLLPCFAVLRMGQVFASSVTWDMRLNMIVSYGFLIPVIATILYVLFYLKNESGISKKISYLGIVCNSLFFLKMLQYGSRGPILCIVILLVFLYVSSCKNRGVSIGSGRLRIVLSIVAIILFGGFALLSIFSGFLENAGFHIRSVEKILVLGAEDNLSNGRDQIIYVTLDYIMDNPLWGYGVDRFDELTNGLVYPHNFILQLLFDGGILLFFVVMVPICVKLKQIWKCCSKEQYIFLSMIIFASVPGALFSGNLWHIVALWVALGAIVKCNIYEP